MAKQKRPFEGQMSLDLNARPERVKRDQPVNRLVVAFADATALKVRREAVARVRSTGIFVPVPPPKQ